MGIKIQWRKHSEEKNEGDVKEGNKINKRGQLTIMTENTIIEKVNKEKNKCQKGKGKWGGKLDDQIWEMPCD